MKLNQTAVAALSLLFMLNFNANAAESKASGGKSSDSTGLLNSFHCEKFTGGLGDLKLKLIESCNLEKPFTSSITKSLGGEELYLVCCHNSK